VFVGIRRLNWLIGGVWNTAEPTTARPPVVSVIAYSAHDRPEWLWMSRNFVMLTFNGVPNRKLELRARKCAPPEPHSAAGGLAASVRRNSHFGKLLDCPPALGQVRQAHAAEHVRGFRELDVCRSRRSRRRVPGVVEIEE